MVSILDVHNHSMSHLTLYCWRKKKVCFSLEMLHSWLVTHTYLTSFLAVDRIQHVQLLPLNLFLGGFVFGFYVFICVCVPTYVCAAAAAQPWLVTQIFSHSGWKHHFDIEQGCLWQCSPPAVPTSLTQYLKMLLVINFLLVFPVSYFISRLFSFLANWSCPQLPSSDFMYRAVITCLLSFFLVL